MNVRLFRELAALPQHTAERLRLSGAQHYKFYREALPRVTLSVASFLLAAFCLLPSAFSTTWTRQQSGTMAWLHAVYFLDQRHGWVGGSGGTLLETTDGGQTWKRVSILTNDTLNDIYFADDHVGWLLAERDILKLKSNDQATSYLMKTEDGGISWHEIFLDGPEANSRLVRAMFANPERGWVFGETGVIFATVDGGAHWRSQASPTKYLLLTGATADSDHGWLAGAAGTILQTDNGGISWHSGSLRATRINGISFVGNRLGWAVGPAGGIFATTDGGRTWFAQRSPENIGLLDVKFIDASDGWTAGEQGTLLHTIDGGGHWSIEPTGTSHTLQRLFFVDREHGWAVGFGGTILALNAVGAPRLKSRDG